MAMKIIKYLMFVIIPSLSVLICLMFNFAQGEKVEEIVFGIMLGLVLDLIYLIILLITKRKTSHNRSK
ncbi:MAG: hypothetical protein J6A67_07500 [Clostridia bacterium]|nr:hypothetical protein [Clostridia bacterium]MBR3815226.1 hypothetical protein [Clostridia bacterium]